MDANKWEVPLPGLTLITGASPLETSYNDSSDSRVGISDSSGSRVGISNSSDSRVFSIEQGVE